MQKQRRQQERLEAERAPARRKARRRAIPFLATALAFNRMTTAFAVVKRHFPVIVGAGGAVLIVMGALIWTGELFQLNIKAQQLLESLGLDFFNHV